MANGFKETYEDTQQVFRELGGAFEQANFLSLQATLENVLLVRPLWAVFSCNIYLH